MPPVRVRAHALAAGAVEVHGDGPMASLVAAHLGPEVTGRPVWVVVELVAGGSGRAEEGDPVRVACAPTDRSMGPVLDAIRLAAARRSATLTAGVAFGWDGAAVVVRGPSGSGKTGVLLRGLERGASLVAAETCWVDAAGRVWPLPQPVRVRPHHLVSPVVRAVVRPGERLRLAFGRALPDRWARRAFVDVPSDRFGGPRDRAGDWRLAGEIDLGGRDEDAVVDEAERLARRSSGTGGLPR